MGPPSLALRLHSVQTELCSSTLCDTARVTFHQETIILQGIPACPFPSCLNPITVIWPQILTQSEILVWLHKVLGARYLLSSAPQILRAKMRPVAIAFPQSLSGEDLKGVVNCFLGFTWLRHCLEH